MNILSVHDVTRLGREKPLFTHVSFGLNEGEKAALIGKNGGGKSTLLNIIAGTISADEGEVVIHDKSVSFLPQIPVFDANDSILDHIFKNAQTNEKSKLATVRRYEEVCEKFEKFTDGNIPESLQSEFEKITLEMDKRNLWSYENSVKQILTELGIVDFERKMGELSGGMTKKVALAQVLVEDTKLLLLDEPTNHLDIATISYLQEYLKDTDRAVLMVTHDRYFLDAVCTNIYELDRERVKLYQGNYSTYLDKKEIEMEIEENTDRRMGAFLRVEKDWLMRGPCARGTKAKARIQNIAKLTSDHKRFEEQKKIDDKTFAFETNERRLGGKILELEGICKNFQKAGVAGSTQAGAASKSAIDMAATTKLGVASKSAIDIASHNTDASNQTSRPVLKDFTFTFNKGDKIGVFGNNGSGKSTLLNIITGRLQADSGTITVGQNTHIAYYEQNPIFLDKDQTVLEYLKDAAENITMKDGKTYSASQMLENFGFEGRMLYSPVTALSGGERKRLYLVRLLLSNPNFLIMDEPTNDFDIFTMQILESFLENFTGCLLIVSHDRYFMDKVADTLLVLEEDGSVTGYVGKCSEYIEFDKERKLQEKAKGGSLPHATAGKPSSATPSARSNAACNVGSQDSSSGATEKEPKKKKLSFKEQKEFEQLETDIMELEGRKEELEAIMSGATGDFSQIDSASKEYSTLTETLEAKYKRWEELAI